MRSKEEILNSSTIPDEMQTIWQYVQRPAAINAMGEYGKEVAIEFAKFRDKYKRNELKEVKKEQERLGGIFTWMEASDEIIFNQFLQETKQS